MPNCSAVRTACPRLLLPNFSPTFATRIRTVPLARPSSAALSS
jgi:hypothetical protein